MLNISVIILTFNEELHIARCIESVRSFAKEIFIVDSFSTDHTIEIAQSLGVRVFSNPFVDCATQFNWGLDNIPVSGEWILRLDADEYVTESLAQVIKERIPVLASTVSGIYVARRVFFMGKWIRHGGFYPIHLLRIWRRGKGRCEQRKMDEHIYLLDAGDKLFFPGDIVDDNKNNITWWTNKHNRYSTSEMIDSLKLRYGLSVIGSCADSKAIVRQAIIKRWIKSKVYLRLPMGFRALLYFLHRYFLMRGFLDGRRGLIFHFLQGFWYRFLVDVKLFEFERKMRDQGLDAKTLLSKEFGIEVERVAP